MGERDRLAAVRRYGILDMPAHDGFDRITAMAARMLNVPIALLSIVDQDRIWFKSRYGFDIEQIDRDLGLCASCVLQANPWIVNDARSDVRALANPLVAGEPGIRFYLGIPLRTHDGFNLGTLCVLDFAPRSPKVTEITLLKDLAAIVMNELELRLSARRSLANYHEELLRRELREDHIRGLMRELAHRSKNLLAVVQAIARHTAPPGANEQRFAAALSGRVQGLSYTHDLVAAEDWRGARLGELASRQLAHFVEPIPPRVYLTGPSLMMSPAAAQHVGLALHELAANAIQYGALSIPKGSVSLRWDNDARLPLCQWIRLTWSESCGPRVIIPEHRKFGSLILERLVPEALGGGGQMIFRDEGVTWICEAPADRIVA